MLHSAHYLIADATHFVSRQTFRIAQGPVVSAQARNVGAFVPAPHCDEQCRVIGKFLGQLLRLGGAEVYPYFLHHGKNFRMATLSHGVSAWFNDGSIDLGEHIVRAFQEARDLSSSNLAIAKGKQRAQRIGSVLVDVKPVPLFQSLHTT